MSQQIESVKMALQELGINASGEFYYNPGDAANLLI